MTHRKPTNNRGKQVSEAEFRRLWTDPSLTGRDVARALGVTDNAVISRAAARGLDRQGYKKAGELQRSIGPSQEAELRRLWAAGVSNTELAQHFGCNPVSIWRAAPRLRLPKRKAFTQPMPLLAVLMVQSATQTAAAFKAAQMVDGSAKTGRWAQ